MRNPLLLGLLLAIGLPMATQADTTSAWQQAAAQAASASAAAQNAATSDLLGNGSKTPPKGSQADNWLQLRKAIGIKPNDHLYIFVSMSMPHDLLRAYEADASRAGASLVVRGIPQGDTLKSYINQTVKSIFGPLVQAPLQIDPRLFDRYSITTVPTIVFAEADTVPCNNTTCDIASPDSFSSIEGNVTLLYALQQFQHAGVPDKAFLSAMQRGYTTPYSGVAGTDENAQGKPPEAAGMDKKSYLDEMRPLWEQNSALLEKSLQQQGWSQYLKRYQTQFGPAFGPPGMMPGE